MSDDPALITVRPIEGRDRESTQELIAVALDGTSHIARAREVLEISLGRHDREHRALVAERSGRIVGVVCHGDLIGAERVARLHFLALASTNEREAARELIRAVDAAASSAGARFVFTELADEPPAAATFAALREADYREETRIADYVRDGVALVFLKRSL